MIVGGDGQEAVTGVSGVTGVTGRSDLTSIYEYDAEKDSWITRPERLEQKKSRHVDFLVPGFYLGC